MDIHITSLLLRTLPEKAAAVKSTLATWPNTEVAYSDASGKTIALLETDDSRKIQEWINEAEKLEGVLSVFMVYQHHETAHSLNEVYP